MESVGQIDPYAEAEVIALAAKSLKILSEDYVLDLSDVSFIRCLLGGMNLSQGDQEQALALIAQKNAPGIQAMADRGILSARGVLLGDQRQGLLLIPLGPGLSTPARQRMKLTVRTGPAHSPPTEFQGTWRQGR